MEWQFFRDGAVLIIAAFLTTLFTQCVKIISRRVTWVPTLRGAASAAVAYFIATLAIIIAVHFDVLVVEYQGSIRVTIVSFLSLGVGALSTSIYHSAKYVATRGEKTP